MKLFGPRQQTELSKTYTPEGIIFSFDGAEVPAFPLNTNEPRVLAKLLSQGAVWASLDSLWAGELLVQRKEREWIVPYEVYEKIDPNEECEFFNALMIPVPESLKIDARSVSHVGDDNFRILVEAFHPDHGPLREGELPRCGRVFWINEKTIVPLIETQEILFEEALGKQVDWDKLEDRMAYFAKVKQAALDAGATIDAYLEKENYDFRTEAALDFNAERPDEITLKPQIEGLENYGKSGEELLQETVPAVLTKADPSGLRRRMVLDKNLRENLAQLPKYGKIRGVDVPRFLTNPEQMIPEGFDLSLFSKRVKGIKTRVYNSRPYIHVKRSQGGWFEGVPGVHLDDWSPVGIDREKGERIQEGSKPEGLSEETYRELLKRAKETGEDYVLHEGNWIRVDTEAGEHFENALDSMTKDGDVFRIPSGSILDVYENLGILEFVDEKPDSGEEGFLPDDLPELFPPDSFSGNLYRYQLLGFRWLSRLSDHFIGGLLADEMGLGKTVQVIAHFLRLKETAQQSPHLVVLPKTLMENWIREIGRFSQNGLKAYSYEGPNRLFSSDFFRKFDVVLTTYETLRRDQARLATIDWNMVVCDEAQYAKNPTTQRTCAVKALKAKHRAALTGTPVENGLIEFWCIMDFVQPGLLGSWADFRKKYERPIVEGEESERENQIQNLLGEIKGHYLRRLKSETLNLLPKEIEYRETTLSEVQLESYKRIAHIGRTGGKNAALGAIQKLIMLCAHPVTAGQQDCLNEDSFKIPCPKLDEAMRIVSDVKSLQEKAIIFTDFKKVQRVLQDRLRHEFGIWPDIINGELTKNRQRVIDVFSEKHGFNVIILGHQVAGVGLNITAANHVIHYTRPWNPAKENQATDRAHRIGQEKTVKVYYPIVKDHRFVTVEERLDELIKSKEGLARDVLRPTADFKIRPEELINCLDVPENDMKSSESPGNSADSGAN